MQKDLIATRSPGMPQGFGVGLAFFGTRKTRGNVFFGAETVGQHFRRNYFTTKKAFRHFTRDFGYANFILRQENVSQTCKICSSGWLNSTQKSRDLQDGDMVLRLFLGWFEFVGTDLFDGGILEDSKRFLRVEFLNDFSGE